MKSQTLFLLGLVFATALCADTMSPGIYQSAPENNTTITLSVSPGQLILVTSHFPENAQWYSYGEYEGKAQPAGKDAWTAAWAKKKSTAGNLPIPARTPLAFANGQYLLSLGQKKIALKKVTPMNLVFSGMYGEDGGISGDILFATADKQSFLCALRDASGNVRFVFFPKNGVPTTLTQNGWQFRLTRHLKMTPDSGLRDGTGALVDVKDEKGAFQIQFDGTRTPESDASLTLIRDGKNTDLTGNDQHNSWTRKDKPSERIDAFGEYRRWTDAVHPLGRLYVAESAANMEHWTLVGGGPALEWTVREGGPAVLVLPDKTSIEFQEIEKP